MPQTLISPMLPVRRGQETVAFYKSAFGAEVLYRVEARLTVLLSPVSPSAGQSFV